MNNILSKIFSLLIAAAIIATLMLFIGWLSNLRIATDGPAINLVEADRCLTLMHRATNSHDSLFVSTVKPGDGRFGPTCDEILERYNKNKKK